MFKRCCMLFGAILVGATSPAAWSAEAASSAAAPPAAAASVPKMTVPAVSMPAVSLPAVSPPTVAMPAFAMPVAGAPVPAGTPSAANAASAPADAASAAPLVAPVAGTLDGRVQDVKSDVIKLNRDLLVLEEELLFPANTQVALFVSMDVGKTFELDSVQVKLDDKIVANYLYTALEVESLHRGGVQRVYLGNLRTGEHELTAFFTGKGPHERDYRRGATVKFEKTTEAKYIELRIQDSTGKLQPEFDVKLWQ
ncbi:MAG: hypothetical protein ABI330_01505 [Caldimonas sp.]